MVLITSDDDVIAFFRNKNVLMESRAEYFYLSPQKERSILTDGFQIERINLDNIHRIEGRIIPSFFWETSEQFLKAGFGYVALDQERVCAIAFSAAVSSDEIDIGVETYEDYRRKGLATVLADRMCEDIIEIGKKPVWAHSTSNKGSLNTAIKCGFVLNKKNTVIRKK
jgi:GNAT superfamily N-acetyltransferase